MMRGDLMSNRNLFASILMTCLLAVGFLGAAPSANAASAGQTFLKPGDSARTHVIEVGRRRHGPWIVFPIAPTYRAYDYPYYYSRGYYPRHIGPGYIYYGSPYVYRRSYYPRHRNRCSYWHRRCVANWGPGNEDYYGCMNYHRC
jgi:hypothetical protein